MSSQYSSEPMLDMYLFETFQNTEQLEKIILSIEKTSVFSMDAINEIFRIMHTIKGSSAMMLFNNVASLAHTLEDLFYFIRKEKPKTLDYPSLSDLVLGGVDFIKSELEKIRIGKNPGGDASGLIDNINGFLSFIKVGKNSANVTAKPELPPVREKFYLSHYKEPQMSGFKNYRAVVSFEDGCEMENIRAYAIIHCLKEMAEELYYIPEDIIENDVSMQIIREQGFLIFCKTGKDYGEMQDLLMKTVFIKNLELVELDDQSFGELSASKKPRDSSTQPPKEQTEARTEKEQHEREKPGDSQPAHQSMISVNIAKLDKLMDLMGELVIAEAMVTQNPELRGLKLNSFKKASRQLQKIIGETQDTVMSIRMVPLSVTFQKMHRIVRDMSKKLGKEVQLNLLGEETEVDKNIIEHISDPLMHLVRNSIDHGIESAQERAVNGKPQAGTLTLEAKNAGSDVLVIVRDDGKGLNKEKIIQRARENGLLRKPDNEMTDKEIYNLIFLPGFSTKESITEYSGRGVGMDVVTKNIEEVGGSVLVESAEGKGTAVTLKIPLTLAIIDGMNIRVGESQYTLPTTTIIESFRPNENDIIKGPGGNEMIWARGQCNPILRLHDLYGVKTKTTRLTEGILIMAEQDGKSLCLFADELLGQQQVVVKALPAYMKSIRKINGLAGCTLLGDGSISLILDIGGLTGIGSSM